MIKKQISTRNSIATKLLKVVFSFYVIIAVGVTVVQMVLEYQHQKESIRSDLVKMQKTFEQSLAIDMWQLDKKGLSSALDGMLEQAMITGVKIQNTNNQDIAVGGIITNDGITGEVGRHVDVLGLTKKEIEVHANELYNLDVFIHEFPIFHTQNKQKKKLGEVTIYSNSSVVFQRVKLGFFLLLINALIKTVALWLIFLWFSNILLRKPLEALTDATEQVNLENLDTFKVEIETGEKNELTALKDSFNLMIENLNKSIVEQQQTENALLESEERFRAAFESSEDCILIWDKEYNYLYANQAAIDHVGTTREKVIGMNIRNGLGHIPDFMNLWMGRVDTVFKTKKTLSVQDETILDGIQIYTESELSPIFNPDGSVSAVCVVYRDITDRKKAETELEKARNYITNIIDSMPSVLVGVDNNGNVTQWNKTAEQTTQISAKEAQGKKLSDVFPHMASEMEMIAESIKTRKTKSDLKKPRKTDCGTGFEDITIYPLVANGVEGAVIRIDDVTDKVRMEEMMIQSEKMLSVGGLAAGMAHEINNPLAGMMQTSEVVLNRLTTDMPANNQAAEKVGTSIETIKAFMDARAIPEMLNNIHKSGVRAAKIVADMLSFARKSDSFFSSVDMEKLIDQTTGLASSDYDLRKSYDFRQIEIVHEYENDLPLVPCESGKIQQVLLNILRNGAEAIHEASEKGKDSSPCLILRLAHEKETGMFRIEIEDNGTGMDEETRKRVFEPFYTTKPTNKGTGLGMSVSYFIITENHDGEMAVESTPGKGTKFIIRLPIERK